MKIICYNIFFNEPRVMHYIFLDRTMEANLLFYPQLWIDYAYFYGILQHFQTTVYP
ncbi:hypothetical protein SAMN02745220_04055 [Desulfopila aestuarii DSM 18488]|uniref:Uncharacterized protein n=1 Tax=Desulfopila aestuarii DSM 18488 TaxID=1121416 RepID=A0A1M7YFZ3_9BACT|nr:hypothetical protein SAMN02745220_04055 [Desulfopila aestuarii DSM 18488]